MCKPLIMNTYMKLLIRRNKSAHGHVSLGPRAPYIGKNCFKGKLSDHAHVTYNIQLTVLSNL